MQFKKLGKNGPIVSQLCFGTLTLSPLQKNLKPEDGARLLLHARERGVNFCDTSEFYRNYEPIRLALKEAPDLVVCTKSYCYDKAGAQTAFEQALRGLDRDYIDLFLLHEQESIHTLRGHEEALLYLARQKELGHIGQIGISTHFQGCVRSARLFPNIDIIMPLLNISGIGIPDGSREDMEDAVREAYESGIGIYLMKVLGGGSLIGKRQEALNYALSFPYASSIAIGMQSIDEIDVNCDIFEGKPVPEETDRRISTQRRHLLIDTWCEGCGRCAERCKQKALYIKDGVCHLKEDRCALCGYCIAACPVFCLKII